MQLPGLEVDMKKVISFTAILLAFVMLIPGSQVLADVFPFVDVPESGWYFNAVHWCYENGLVKGTSASTFSPAWKMTRSQVIQILWNLEGNPAAKESWYFVDGGEGQGGKWYTDALNWGYEAGLILGVIRSNIYGSEYRYADPELPVTRAQLVTFLHRYLMTKGLADDKSNIATALIFADYKATNDWNIYKSAMAWATEARIINGIEKTGSNGKIGMYFAPGDGASRAEAAQFFYNVMTAELTGEDNHIHHFNTLIPSAEVESTCTSHGKSVYKCNGCLETRDVKKALLNHTYVLTSSVNPTCTQNGSKTYKCTVCGHVNIETTAKLGHNYVQSAKVDATYRTEGYILYKCTRCGDSYKQSIAKLEPGAYQRVINRTYTIPANYISNFQLVLVENGQYMVSDAAAAMKRMVADLRAAGMSIIVQSGYRSDDTQTYLNNYYTKLYGNKYKAATISAIPYSSEHQAGLAMDLSTNGQLEQWFGSTAQGKWLAAHCSEYGYILRYTKEKQKYTGVIYEPWHFRYVGSPELAKDITASGLSMEEYFGRYLAPNDITPYLPYLN